MQIRKIPYVPGHFPVDVIQQNLKLYTDEDIAWIKSSIKSDGRHRFIDKHGKQERLTHSVIHMDGTYVAVVDRKTARVGRGGFGSVKLGQDLDTGEWLAVKVSKNSPYYNACETEDFEQMFAGEKTGLSLSRSSLFTRDHARPLSFIQQKGALEDKTFHFYHVSKLIKGVDLTSEHLKRCPLGLKIDASIAFLQAIAANLQSDVIHRDVKSEHFIFDLETGSGSLVDYGFGIYAIQPDAKAVMCGTLPYVDPELDTKSSHGGVKVKDFNASTELYAAAVTLGQFWEVLDIHFISHKFKNLSDVNYSNIFAKLFCHSLQDSLRLILDRNSAERPTIADMIRFLQDKKKFLPKDQLAWSMAVVDVADLNNIDIQYLVDELSNSQCIMLHDSSSSLSTHEMMQKSMTFRRHGLYVSSLVSSGPLAELNDYVIQANQTGADRRLRVINLDAFRVKPALGIGLFAPQENQRDGVVSSTVSNLAQSIR